MKNVDFVAQMELFLEALFKDATTRDNAIVFNYNPNYPRYLSFEAHKLIGAIKNLSKFYLNSVSNSKLLISFTLVSYSLSLVHFDIHIRCTSCPQKPNEKLVKEAGELLKELNAKMNKAEDGFNISISVPLPKSGTFKRQSVEIASLLGKNAIIACDDENLFLTLSHELSFTGLKLSKQKSFESLNLQLTYQKLKNFYIVIISKDEAKSIKSEKMTTLRQPFTSDSLHETLGVVARNL